MTKEKIDQFVMANADKFPAMMMGQIRQKLADLDESQETMLLSTEWKSPGAAIALAFFVGGLGADRFYLGQTGLGIVKLITCGCVGIWSLIDLFTAMGRARKYNYNTLMMRF